MWWVMIYILREITFVMQEYPLHSLPNKSNKNKQIEFRNVLVLQISFPSCKIFLILLTNCSAMPGDILSFTIKLATTFRCCKIMFNFRNWFIATRFVICNAFLHLSLSTCVKPQLQYFLSLAYLFPSTSPKSLPDKVSKL